MEIRRLESAPSPARPRAARAAAPGPRDVVSLTGAPPSAARDPRPLAAAGAATALAAAPAPAGVRAALRRLLHVFAHPRLDPAVKADLMREAADPSRSHLAWPPGRRLAEAHNAHYTNTPPEIRGAFRGPFDFLEGDIRLEGLFRRLPIVDRWREPVMAHDPQDVDGVTFGEWLDLGVASGRGLKLDVKQAAALPKIAQEVAARNIPQERLIFNADVTDGPGGDLGPAGWLLERVQDLRADLDELQSIRAQFPRSFIALGARVTGQPAGTRYTPAQCDTLARMADRIGGPIMFTLRAEFVDAAVVARLKPHGEIAIWNDPSTFNPRDIPAEIRRLRAMGVDGMIDLRQR